MPRELPDRREHGKLSRAEVEDLVAYFSAGADRIVAPREHATGSTSFKGRLVQKKHDRFAERLNGCKSPFTAPAHNSESALFEINAKATSPVPKKSH